MITTKPSVIRKGVICGLATTGGLIAYFMLMKLFSLEKVVELRYLNFFILTAGMVWAFRSHIHTSDEHPGKLDFFELLGLGILTSAVAVLVFGLFMLIYLGLLDTTFMTYLQENELFGEYMTPFTAAFVICMEGLASGLILTLILFQYYKKYTSDQF